MYSTVCEIDDIAVPWKQKTKCREVTCNEDRYSHVVFVGKPYFKGKCPQKICSRSKQFNIYFYYDWCYDWSLYYMFWEHPGLHFVIILVYMFCHFERSIQSTINCIHVLLMSLCENITVGDEDGIAKAINSLLSLWQFIVEESIITNLSKK